MSTNGRIPISTEALPPPPANNTLANRGPTTEPIVGRYGRQLLLDDYFRDPGWAAALCGIARMQPIITTAMTAEAIGRLSARPP
jgi:hypothetical protein